MKTCSCFALALATVTLFALSNVAQTIDLPPPPPLSLWQVRSWSLFNRNVDKAAPEGAKSSKADAGGPVMQPTAAASAVDTATGTQSNPKADAAGPAVPQAETQAPVIMEVMTETPSPTMPTPPPTPLPPSGLPEAANWRAIASSQRGDKLSAVSQGGSVWLSKDFGKTWQRSAGAPVSDGFVTVASSADGSRLAAGVNPRGRMLLSNDSGLSWSSAAETQRNGSSLPKNPSPWNAVAMSRDGSTVVAAEQPGHLFISHDFGSSFSSPEGLPSSALSFTSVAVSDDGETIAACTYGRGNIFVSRDGGKTFDAQTGVPKDLWQGVALSADGNELVAVSQSPGSIWTSQDAGRTWMPQNPGGAPASWRHVASSADGSVFVAAVQNGGVWRSVDSGTSWEQMQGGLPVKAAWFCVAMSSDGSVIAAVENRGRIWVSPDSGQSWMAR